MAKTEVILTHNIVGLGGESDQVKVAAGYARNYLFPQGLAVPVTGANKRRLDALKKRRGERIAMLTAYDYTMARLVDEAGVDMVLVGDSLGMVVQGLSNTIPVTLEEIMVPAPGPGEAKTILVMPPPPLLPMSASRC